MYRFLVNPSQAQYQVVGHEIAVSAEQSSPPPTPAASSETSLLLKPDKGATSSQKQTLSRTENSAQALPSNPNSNARIDAEAPAPVLRASDSPTDALDDAIEEAKTIKDLVCIANPSNSTY